MPRSSAAFTFSLKSMKSSMYSSSASAVTTLSRLFFLKMWAKSSEETCSPATVRTVCASAMAAVHRTVAMVRTNRNSGKKRWLIVANWTPNLASSARPHSVGAASIVRLYRLLFTRGPRNRFLWKVGVFTATSDRETLSPMVK